MSSTLFRKASLDSISSPEQLNDYIKVSNPSVWMVLTALFILLAAVIVWSITGSLPTCINTAGVMHGGEAVCYLSTADAGKVKIGQEVELQAAGQNETIKGKVAGIAGIPMSAGEITAELKNDYLTQTLAPKGFAVKINISVNNSDMAEGTLLNLSIVTDAVKPVDFLLK